METLLLTNGFEPLGQIEWTRAITLLTLGKVEVVEEYEDRFVRSQTWQIKMPSIVRLLRAFKKGKRKGPVLSRENVYLRDKGKCQYCGCKVKRSDITYDHVVPKSQGGTTRWDNIVISCLGCNQHKGGRTPEQAGMTLITEPVRPRSIPHSLRLKVTKNKMPEEWEPYLRSVLYMYSELEQD